MRESNWRSSWTIIREKLRADITYIRKLEVTFCLHFFFSINFNVNKGRRIAAALTNPSLKLFQKILLR